MKGIMAKAYNDAEGRPGDGSAEMAHGEETLSEAATPQEEQAMTSVLNAALKTIYDDASHPRIMAALQKGKRPDQALASVATSILLEIDRQARGRIPETVILPGAVAIVGMLAEVAQSAGLFEVDDAVLAAAGQQVTLTLMQEYGVNPQDVQALVQKIGPEQVRGMVSAQQQIAQRWANEAPSDPQPLPQQPMTG